MIAVTGAGGFLGRRIVARLAQKGHAVRALTRDPSAPLPQGASESARYVAGAQVDLSGVEVLVHAAAHRPARYDDPSEADTCLQINASATARLAADAVAAGVRRFVYVSSGPVTRRAGLSASALSSESDPVWPASHAPYYLASKLCGEFFLSAEAARSNLPVAIVRPSAIYGPNMKPGIVSTFLSRLGAGQPVKVTDGGRYIADLVYVDDVADGICALVEGQHTGTFNLGGGHPTTTREIAEILCEALGADPSLVTVEPSRGGEPPGLGVLDISLARQTFGYAPRGVREGIAATVAAVRPSRAEGA